MNHLIFVEIVYYVSYFAIIPLFILSIYFLLKKKFIDLFLRHISGFIIGLIDQLLMILFKWQSNFYLIVLIFNYELYGIWYLIMPDWRKVKNLKICLVFWSIFSGLFNTLLENIVRIYSYGNLNYPVGWTIIHTIFFYLGMHSLGTFIATINIISKKINIMKK